MSFNGVPFHVMAKPVGASCNLNCSYCFYHDKEALYPHIKLMSDQVLDTYLRQVIQSEPTDQITIAWQGGEPTLASTDFYERAATLAAKYLPSGKRIQWTIQTNGVLLNDEWCKLFKKLGYLVGLSLDGPRSVHDAYRVDRQKKGTFDRVIKAVGLLQRYKVEYNVLTCVNSANCNSGREVYRFLRDQVDAKYIQFIPVVKRINSRDQTRRLSSQVTAETVKPKKWGEFLNAVFDEWVRHDVGKVFVLLFDWTLASWLGMEPPACIFQEKCGRAVVVEHNGDVYSCDHFVDSQHLLGNIVQKPVDELVFSNQQLEFATEKSRLPTYCVKCHVRFACNGECPKNRFITARGGECGLNYLCTGYKDFFTHTAEPMQKMANLIRKGSATEEIMAEYDPSFIYKM